MSSLSHICQALLGPRFKERVISVLSGHFTCYWDESGIDPGTRALSKSNRPYFVVAGYLAHVDEWQSLEERWSEVLNSYGLSRFKMADFCNFQRPYSEWSEEKREQLIHSLLDIVRDVPRMFVSWSLKVDDYMSVVKARHLREVDILRAYHILAFQCIDVISTLALAAGYKEKILHIFDQGNSAWPTFESSFTPVMLNVLNILRPTSQSSMDVPALQAADILVHQLGRLLTIGADGSRKSRRMYANRLEGKPGLKNQIGRGELLNIYHERMRLEYAQRMGIGFNKTIRARLSDNHVSLAKHLFVPPKEYEINDLLKSLQ